MLSNRGAGQDSLECVELQGDETSQSWRKSTLNIHWKDWCWCSSSNILATLCKEPTPWKDRDVGKDGRLEKGTTEGEVVGWYHGLNGYGFEQAPGDSAGQGSLVCCSPWGCRELHMTLEKAMAPHSSTLAWKIPWTEEPDRLQSMGSLRVGHNWATSLSLFTFMHWRRQWQPTPVFLPGESQGRGSRLWGHTESDTTEST